MTLLGPRRRRPEILDGTRRDPGELESSLAHVSAVNRWLGGDRALRLHLEGVAAEVGESARLLDVGAGDAGLLRRLGEAWDEARFVGVDLHADVLRIARERTEGRPDVHLVRADGLRLPFPDDAFHASLCTLTLHHFREAGAVALLLEMARVASLRVLVCDLERTLPNYLGARILALTAWRRNRITRHDGPLSVLRSFTPDELRALAREAGLEGVRVRRRFPWRLVLDARPPGGGPNAG